MSYRFDVVLSFAGEQRSYVEEVANHLRKNNVNIFYDEYNELQLWGKDLIEEFDKVYQNEGKYCLMFISKEYVETYWPSHERRSALARALKDREYLLPVRFDKTPLPGLPDTIGYLNAHEKSPLELSNIVIKKLEKFVSKEEHRESANYRVPKMKQRFNPYETAQEWINFISKELKRRSDTLRKEVSISTFDHESKNCIRVVLEGKAVYSLDIIRGKFSSEKGLSFYGVKGEIGSFSSSYNAFGEFEWSKEKNEIVIKLMDMGLIEMLSTKERSYTKNEFLQRIWEKICDAIEEI